MLHWKLFRSIEDVPKLTPNEPPCIVLPVRWGRLFLSSLLIGMPYCTDFFFYEENHRSDGQRKLRRAINEILGRSPGRETDVADGEPIEFEFDSIPRRAWIVHQDNMTFLEKEILLTFYFRRGDSGECNGGEGGSGQRWDSDLLPQLLAKSDPGIGCHIFTRWKTGRIVGIRCNKVSKSVVVLLRTDSTFGRQRPKHRMNTFALNE